MKAEIANLFAAAGVTILQGYGLTETSSAVAAFKKALKMSPPIFFTEKTARRVLLGNFEQHFQRIAGVDWVIEAVVEDPGTKQQLMERLEGSTQL